MRERIEGNLSKALAAYTQLLETLQNRKAKASINETTFTDRSERILIRMALLASDFVFARQPGLALQVASLADVPNTPANWLPLVCAHAKLLLGEIDAARGYYFSLATSWRDAQTSWERVVMLDFRALRASGFTHPLMDEAEKRYMDAGWSADRISAEVPADVTAARFDGDPPASLKLGRETSATPATEPREEPHASQTEEPHASDVLASASDSASGDKLLTAGRLEDALIVYKRSVENCNRRLDARQVGRVQAASYLSETERLLTAEVADLRRLHSLSLRLAEADTLVQVLIDVLRTAAGLVDARLGSVQLLTPEGTLGMIGQVGFGDDILKQFAVVSLHDCSTCAVALNRRSRVIVRDLRVDADFTEIAGALRSYGAVAAVSTPILDKGGNVLAMFSLYWLEEHEPSARELRVLDLCAELAGRHVERSAAASTLREHDRRQDLLMRELAHRGKNLLAVIQSIAIHTLRGERTLDEAREVLIGRLGALANTYNTLTDEAPESAPLHEIISASLKLYNERVSAHGPTIVISAKIAQTLTLVMHELATNAAKYGALSVGSGRVEVSWKITRTDDDGEQFTLDWSESGGPPPELPRQHGFGSTIITKVVGIELRCSPTVEYQRCGFHYRLDCPLRALLDTNT